MLVGDRSYRTVWMEGSSVFMIDQNHLPFDFQIRQCRTYWETCMAITDMVVRGAGAIGAAAGYAMAQAFLSASGKTKALTIREARSDIEHTRPTAENLFYAVDRVYKAGLVSPENAVNEAQRIAEKDAEDSKAIGVFGINLMGARTNILTHCNAGWLAFVDYGTALAPIYLAHSQQMVVFGGADRIAANGDVANKIGTLEKAILAKEFNIPFYVAAPTSTFDLNCATGKDIPIEMRDPDEVLYQTGIDANGNKIRILVSSPGSEALNPAFDVTPAKYISGIITEKGIVKAHQRSIEKLIQTAHV